MFTKLLHKTHVAGDKKKILNISSTNKKLFTTPKEDLVAFSKQIRFRWKMRDVGALEKKEVEVNNPELLDVRK